jgi:hypothetical protein
MGLTLSMVVSQLWKEFDPWIMMGVSVREQVVRVTVLSSLQTPELCVRSRIACRCHTCFRHESSALSKAEGIAYEQD